MRALRPGALAVVVASALLLTSCGGDDEEMPSPDPHGLEHVHGLGIDPSDGALHIATHRGLFRLADGAESPERVGSGLQDTMGFTVVGPGRFVASGHPGPGEPGPPHLGLVESTDGGESWRQVSLAGEADFHVLRAGRGDLYGYDGLSGRLLRSDDGGESWDTGSPPAPLIDLAIDPSGQRRVIASTEAGLALSRDRGQDWRPLGRADRLGLLAWPVGDRLYLVDGFGGVHRSSDGGRRWVRVGEVGGQPAALVADGSRELHVALVDGTILRSLDGGVTWSVRSRP